MSSASSGVEQSEGALRRPQEGDSGSLGALGSLRRLTTRGRLSRDGEPWGQLQQDGPPHCPSGRAAAPHSS